MNWWFISDEHVGHRKIIEYCKRPFNGVHEMNEAFTKYHNELVKGNDIVIHAGDFALQGWDKVKDYIKKLHGKHIFLKGSHDQWCKKFNPLELTNIDKNLGQKIHDILQLNINGQRIVVCHYAMRTWPASHYGSLLFYGHSHGILKPFYNAYDIGVDNNNYRPILFEDAVEKIKEQNKLLGDYII